MKDLHIYNPTILCAVPKLFQSIYSKINYIPTQYVKYSPYLKNKIKTSIFGKNFRFATVGGASISKELLEFYETLDIQLYQGYGMTETSPMVSLNVPNSNRIGSVGKILDCNKVIIDPISSEISVTGDNVMHGYYLHDQVNSLYRTGDIGSVVDGYLYITGRIKEQYKLSNGKFVNPTQIEDILSTLPSIKQIMICAHKNQEYNVALCVSDSSSDIVMKEILSISHKLKKYEIPKKIIVIKEPFTIENGMLSAKYSLRRHNIILRYYSD
jgi:long-chain acyl-CoA synthetase